MERTGRRFVILTVAAWLAALTPASAAPGPLGDDPVRIGIGIGGELIDVLSHDEDEGGSGDEGGGEGGDEGGEGGDEGGENGDGVLDELVNVVDKVLSAVFGGEDDSEDATSAVPVAAPRPADERQL